MAVVVDQVRRGDVFLVDLNPTRGREIQKTRPCVVVSPDELNLNLTTFIVAPLTTGRHAYPFRVSASFDGKDGHIVLDQIRAVDNDRFVKKLGAVSPTSMSKVLKILQEMFAP